jgi:MFS family permease
VAHSQFALLFERRFAPYFVTQFLGAFNDNVFKNALLLLIAFHAADRFTLSSDVMINLSAGLFVLPFFLFSGIAGQLADKYEKSRLIRQVKLLEIGIMLAAAAALILDQVAALIALLFLMGAQSSLFGPVKYGLLPQVTEPGELLGANGLVETGTFLAILLGTALGGVLIGVAAVGRELVAAAVVVLAVLGYLASRRIPVIPALAPALDINWNPFSATAATLRAAGASRMVLTGILGISWFWLLGSTYLAQLPNYTRLTLGGDERVVTLLLTLFSIGVGVGSLLCERLSQRLLNLRLGPVGALGMTVFGLDLGVLDGFAGDVLLGLGDWLEHGQARRVCADVLLLGTAGGLYIVPLYTVVQQRSDRTQRARVIAANNVCNALFMVVAALLAALLLGSGLAIGQLFVYVSLSNLLVAALLVGAAPAFRATAVR